VIETFLTIDQTFGPEEIKEKGSRFISFIYPVKTKDAAETAIAGLRKKYYDSTHVCFAYRLGEGVESYFRYNDDGEPSGTAGLPIYNEIKSKSYFNILAAVVRYYGGTKLGTGGLTRAYGRAAKLVLDASVPVTVRITCSVSLSLPYDFTGELMHLINRFSIYIQKQEYSSGGIDIELDVPVAALEEFKHLITERSGGKIKLN
jgi:uncharacterized YigZ family protein